MTLVWERSPG